MGATLPSVHPPEASDHGRSARRGPGAGHERVGAARERRPPGLVPYSLTLAMSMLICLISVTSLNIQSESSRPRPLFFIPPNGASWSQ